LCFYLCVCFPLVCTFVELFLSVRLFPLICTFVQLFLSVRLFSSCLFLCSIVSICTSVSSYMHFCSIVSIDKGTNKRNTHAQIKIIEQRYKQEENTRTNKNNGTKVQTRGKQTHFICACLLLVCTFVQLFLSVRVFSSCLYLCWIVSICTSVSSYMHFCSIVSICAFVFLLFVLLFNCFYLYVCKQEENTRTDKNNWTKVQTRGIHTHR
jgi:hypothetical protein